MRVLIAEDNLTTQQLLTAFLQSWDLDPIVYDNGLDAYQMLHTGKGPQLALLDWDMPGMNGLELCRRLRANQDQRYTYIILLTGRSRSQDMVECLQAGADDYIAKPFEEDELWARIQVGMRMVGLWEQLLALEKDRVLSQTAGAIAHEISQPLSVIMGHIQLLQMHPQAAIRPDQRYKEIYSASQRISDLLRKMETTRSVSTKPYLDSMEIIDFDQGNLPAS
jgi:DNA-binding response OmpR family regulator